MRAGVRACGRGCAGLCNLEVVELRLELVDALLVRDARLLAFGDLALQSPPQTRPAVARRDARHAPRRRSREPIARPPAHSIYPAGPPSARRCGAAPRRLPRRSAGHAASARGRVRRARMHCARRIARDRRACTGRVPRRSRRRAWMSAVALSRSAVCFASSAFRIVSISAIRFAACAAGSAACRARYHAVRDTVLCGTPYRAGYRAARDTCAAASVACAACSFASSASFRCLSSGEV